MERSLEAIKSYCEVTEDGHWIWERYSACNGKSPIGAFDGKRLAVRRVVYELSGKQIPKGKRITNKCEYDACVNPECLFCGSGGEVEKIHVKKQGALYKARLSAARRSSLDKCKGSKLSHAKAVVIRARLADKKGKAKSEMLKLAEEYGVSLSSIRRVYEGRGWLGANTASVFNPMFVAR